MIDDIPDVSEQLKNNRLKWILAWILATITAVLVGYFAMKYIYQPINDMGNDVVAAIVAAILVGAVLGCAQWLVLRYRLSPSGSWVLATTAASVVGVTGQLVLRWILDRFHDSLMVSWYATQTPVLRNTVEALYGQVSVIDLEGIGVSVILGISLGVGQWIVLRRWIHKAGWWILISGAGSIVAYLIAYRTASEAEDLLPVVYFILYGLFTGGGLLWLLRERETTDQESV